MIAARSARIATTTGAEEAMMELIEKVARAMCIEGGFNPDEVVANDGKRWHYYASGAQAAIRAMLDGVESNLSAVQYDPAPYTAMKHRIAAMRKEVE